MQMGDGGPKIGHFFEVFTEKLKNNLIKSIYWVGIRIVCKYYTFGGPMKKKVFLGITIFLTAFALIACSKDKGGGAPGYYNGVYGNGAYGTVPNANCNMPLGQQPYGAYPNPNCYGNGVYGGGFFGGVYGGAYTAGSCDPRFMGRAQLCPPGYQCQPAGFSGICVRAYY
jgi:hypothetical protein